MSEPELSFHELAQRLRLRELPVVEPSPDLWQRIAVTHAGRMRRARMRRASSARAWRHDPGCRARRADMAGAFGNAARSRLAGARAGAGIATACVRVSADAHADSDGALETQSEIARVDDALQTAYDTGAEKDQLELLWKRRSELLGALISVRQRHVEISRI
jgi:hypothetical protein